METTDKKMPPAYVTYKSFSNFINGLRENGMPSHLTRTMFPGSNSGKATMALSLKSLGLMHGDDLPTPMMKKLVDKSNNYKEVLREVVLTSYDFLTSQDFDIKTTTTDKLAEKFKAAGAGGSTITKCMAFLLSACADTGIEVSKYVKTLPPPPKKSDAGKKRQKPQEPQEDDEEDDDGSLEGAVPEGMDRIVVPLRDMQDGLIFFPTGLDPAAAKKAVKAAIFILNNYYDLEEKAE